MSKQPIEIQEPGLAQPVAAVLDSDRTVALRIAEPRIRGGRLAGLTMWQAIWVLSWPVLCESFLQSLVGLVDTSLSAGISESATDAIGAASYFMWFIALVGMALGVGATALVSRSVGRGRLAVANAAVGQSALASLVSGVATGGLIWVGAPTITDWLNLGDDASRSAIAYLRICAFGVPAFNFLTAGIACLRGAGDSFRPMVTMIVVNIVNIVVSFLLSGVDVAVSSRSETGIVSRRIVFENPSPLELGVEGIAIGTLVGWLVAAGMMFGILIKGTHGLRLMAKRMVLHVHTMKRLVRVGIPNFFETLGLWIGNFIVIMMVGWMNVPGLLGTHVVAVRIEAFSYLPGFAMGMAAATLAGQYLGAGSDAMARRAIWRCTYLGCAIMVCFSAVFLIAPRGIVGVFSQQQMHLELAPSLLMLAGLIQIPFAVSIVMRSALRGAGDTHAVMLLTWGTTYLVRIPLAWLLSGVPLHLPGGLEITNPAPLQDLGVHPLVGLWIGLCLEIVVRCIAFLTRFLRGRWVETRV